MATLVFAFIGTYFLELLYRRISLNRQWHREIKRFNMNKDIIMSINLSDYKLGLGHSYK